MTPKIFLDSDVIVSSLISSRGASHLLLKQKQNYFISTLSVKEITFVIKRLSLDPRAFTKLQKHSVKTIKLTKSQVTRAYNRYVLDPKDAHIVAAAKRAYCRFLITYNLKHYRSESLKRDLNIIVLTPGQYLQYQRSQN